MTTTIDDILEDARKCQQRIAELRDELADEEKKLTELKGQAIRVIEAKLAVTPRKLPRNTRKAPKESSTYDESTNPSNGWAPGPT